jgi:membrane associated rhomboid family serine protease
MKKGGIPVTLILVVIFYLGGEIMDGLHGSDSVSQLTHIVGGLCGMVFGFRLRGGKR